MTCRAAFSPVLVTRWIRFEEDEMIGIVRFTKDDCVRSALCQRTLEAYY